jgi:antitoxin component YwqK of YwqJK toxin-antitoxin module
MSQKQDSHSDLLLHVKSYVIKKYTLKTPKYEFHIEPSSLQIEGSYAMLSAIPLYEDGSYISTEYFEDIVFTLCLKKTDDSWKIIYDLSRNDTPTVEEINEIKKDFPNDFPKKLLPKFWQEQFHTIEISINKKSNILFKEDGSVLLKGKIIQNGKYKVTYNFSTYLIFSVKNSKLDGDYQEFYNNGSISSSGFYKNGKAEGESKNYYKDGKIWFIQQYKNGKLQYQTTYDKDGKIITKE